MEETTSARPEAQSRQAGCLLCNLAIPLFENMWSDATRGHFRNSRIEFLKGIRSIIDDRIAHLSREEAKGRRVVVE
jgi:hypothetical protein